MRTAKLTSDAAKTSDRLSAVVTGGAGGIGTALAARLVRRGYAVVVSDVDEDGARRTAERVGAVAGIRHDVRREGEHRAVADEAQRHGRLAVWCNNAGVMTGGPITEQSAQQVQALVDVNVSGVIWGCRIAADVMGDNGGGDIINTSSLSGQGPVPELAVYAAGKAAVLSLSMSLDSELKASGVSVHAVCPDGAATDLLRGVDGQASALIHSGPRLLTPDEVAEAALSMIGRRRVVRTVPVWRGAMMRLTSMAPSAFMRLEPLMRAQGQRSRLAQERDRATSD
jgi:short-subunit dehydrogenase